ncbi:MAG TPA: photosynthetic reaction center cytochrome c subunit family protein [Bryobacteraceae bacterium]|nr:photosynthetic reaction center cytochrome c subunit family protein [Bryobacteraceae bacterium]
MKLVSRPLVLAAFAAAVAFGQSRPDPKLMADQVFKNVKVLKGLPVDEFMATMGFISASLGETCSDCHSAESGGSWEKYADDTPRKVVARGMIVMMNGINKSYFGGRREVTCYSCHRGVERPRITPSLAELYGPPAPVQEPDRMLQAAGGKSMTADQILDRYIQALGGAEALGKLTSFTGKGMQQSFAEAEKSPFEMWAKAPDERATVIHSALGDSSTVYDGHTAWIAAPATERPVQVFELTDGDLDGAKLDAAITFPTHLKSALTEWRVVPKTTIDGQEVEVLQGTTNGKYPVNLYFDGKTGLLVRMVRYTESPLGLNPTQVDYSDYRDVAGVKMPYRWTVTWLDGKSGIELSDVQANVAVDAAKFAKPSAPAAPAQ